MRMDRWSRSILDQNPDTGSAFYGTEVELAFSRTGQRPRGRSGLAAGQRGWGFKGAPPPGRLGLGVAARHIGGYRHRAARQLGLAPDAAASTSSPPPIWTRARTPLLISAPSTTRRSTGTLPPPLPPDRRAPHLTTYPARGVHGRIARLSYWVLDRRGRTAEVIRIYRLNRLVATLHRPLGDSNPFRLTHVSWRVPKDVQGRLRYSVRSVDAAGNRSKVISAPLRIH